MFFDSKDFANIGAEAMKEIARLSENNSHHIESVQPKLSIFTRLVNSLRHAGHDTVKAQPATTCGDDLASYLT
ncbi:MAG: hypothetical protein R3E39_28865 [Anaerolineae bacterium]